MHSDILDETGLEKATRKWLWYALIPVILFIGVVVVGILIDNNININLKPDPPKGRVMHNYLFVQNNGWVTVPADGKWRRIDLGGYCENLYLQVSRDADFVIQTLPNGVSGRTRKFPLKGSEVIAAQEKFGERDFWNSILGSGGRRIDSGFNMLRFKFDVKVKRGTVQFNNN